MHVLRIKKQNFAKNTNKPKKKGSFAMKNKHRAKFEKKGLYIALCCFALIAAVIGYAGKSDNNTGESNKRKIDTTQLASEVKEPETKLADNVTVEIKDEPAPTPEAPAKSEEVAAAAKTVELSEPEFKMPVDGKIITAFSGDSLVYNDILSDWRTHNGIDIACSDDSAIHAAANGIVAEVYETAQGKTVKIDHQNGYVTIYSNLSDQIEVISGDNVKAGDIIGKVGDTAVADFAEESHLHFEILLNDKYENPEELLKQ